MNRVLACSLLMLLPASAAAQAALKEARQRLLKGNYAEATTAYTALLKDEKARPAAAIGLSRCREETGEYDAALKGIDDALAAGETADLLARRAELLYLRGRWDEALAAADAAVKLAGKQDPFLARWIRASVWWSSGALDKADAEYRWFVRTYSSRSQNDNDITDPEELVLVGRAGVENARWHALTDQFRFILNEVYKDALAADKEYWPAEFHAGAMLLEKYNRGEALGAFDKVLSINPNAADAHAGKARAAIQNYELKDAEDNADKALKVNPRHLEALRVKADLHLMSGDLDAALAVLEKARAVNPRDATILARVAACRSIRKEAGLLAAVIKEAEGYDAKPGLFYHELAERLEERKFYDAAEAYYQKAMTLRPMLPWPKSGLGLLYMRMGREADARKVLGEAFVLDRFNVRVSNTLKVLRHLDKYQTLKTEHFELRYDPMLDAVLARYLAPYLEEVYEHLAAKFDYRPKGPILIEVFNSHEMFSGRTVALPDLHTIGACTGRMVAMASPKAKGIRQPFNWGRVIRHELVHIFNLEQTSFLVPHWLTEGLAVQNEGFPRPPMWNQILKDRLAKNELLNLDTITLGFVRPKSPAEWNLAYCQSLLYVEYAIQAHGPEVVAKLLAAYGEGLDTAAALKKACGVDQAAFEAGYLAYVKALAKGLTTGKAPDEAPLTVKQLEAKHEENPEDDDITARLADAMQKRKNNAQARKLAEDVLKRKPGHPLASVVKARLLTAAGDEDGARTVLETALAENAADGRVLLALGRVYFEAKDFAKAAEVFEKGRKAEPWEPNWLRELLKVYGQTGDTAKQAAVLLELVPTDADDLANRKRLAKLLLDEKRHAEAEKVAREALQIDVQDEDARAALYAALAGQGKNAELATAKKLLEAD